MLSIPQAKTLTQGQLIYAACEENADGSPKRYRVTSVKTWKTRPMEVEIRLRWGIKTFVRVLPRDYVARDVLCATEAEAIEQRGILIAMKLDSNDPLNHRRAALGTG